VSPKGKAKRFDCWDGLADPSVHWPQQKADWCCRFEQLGCSKGGGEVKFE